jgi:hypothetical protein
MNETDPHVHVDRKVVHAGGVVRNMIASAFGLVTDVPSVVTTGCGLQVPRAMTSSRPESVTCLACREHAHREHLRFAEQIEQSNGMPGITGEQAVRTAHQHRDLAKRFAG